MRHGACGAVALVALLVVHGTARNEEAVKGAQAAGGLEASLAKSLREVINRGAALYNKGEHGGCYRLFQGGLIAAEGLLDQRPELQKTAQAALAAAERDPLVWRRAFTLRAALDKVRKGLATRPEKDKDKEKAPEKKEDKKDKKEKKDDKMEDMKDEN